MILKWILIFSILVKSSDQTISLFFLKGNADWEESCVEEHTWFCKKVNFFFLANELNVKINKFSTPSNGTNVSAEWDSFKLRHNNFFPNYINHDNMGLQLQWWEVEMTGCSIQSHPCLHGVQDQPGELAQVPYFHIYLHRVYYFRTYSKYDSEFL